MLLFCNSQYSIYIFIYIYIYLFIYLFIHNIPFIYCTSSGRPGVTLNDDLLKKYIKKYLICTINL